VAVQTVEAIYEHGIFRLTHSPPVPFQEGQRVRIVIDTDSKTVDVLALATSVFDGLSEQDIKDIDTIARRREPFFGNRP